MASLSRAEHRLATTLSEANAEGLLRALAAAAEPVEISLRWRPQLRDPTDELMLETVAADELAREEGASLNQFIAAAVAERSMLVLIQEALKAGIGLGFPLTRMIAHAEAAVDDWKSGYEWVEYEMRLNSVLPNYDDPVICTFDVNLLTVPHAVDILRTHPMVVIGGVLVENSFFTRPQDFIREVQMRTGPSQSYRG